ncbi:GIY-YIG nuclease family protein [Bradyrhizobium ottawaense]|uniref:GIY-YIG nuclease family protein n=1 Tax=Bradyrhizobium ottawaense TaxID=931866 RepID=UPI003D321AD3
MGEIHGWYVYLVEEEGGAFCKIGTALTLDYRLSSLKHGNPRPISIVKSWHMASRHAALQAERKALELCGDSRLKGRDWIRGPASSVMPIIDQAISVVGGRK